MITFKKLPVGTLNVKTGEVTGVQSKVNPPPSIGMDTKEFEQQVVELANKKVPLAKALSAIEQHNDITDKPGAKSMASAIYTILDVKASQPNQSK